MPQMISFAIYRPWWAFISILMLYKIIKNLKMSNSINHLLKKIIKTRGKAVSLGAFQMYHWIVFILFDLVSFQLKVDKTLLNNN